MRLLLVGGNGFIGTPLTNQLIEAGHEVAIFHRSVEGARAAGAAQIQGDRNRLRDYKDELGDFCAHVIIDLLLSSGRQAEELAAIATEAYTRVVAVSSMDVYRAWGVVLGTEPGGLEPMPITEDSPLRTARRTYPPEMVKTMKAIFTWLNEEYDKVAVEQAVMRGGAANTVVRLPMVYGPGDPLHRMHGVLKRIADRRPAIILAEDYAAWRGPRGYVENVAHAIALAATSQRASGRTYHVCEEPCLSDLDWQKQIVAGTSWDGRFVVLPTQKAPKHLLMPGNASQHIVADSQRIRSELGYKELVTIDEAIRRTIAWERENPPAGPSFHKFDYAAEDAAQA
jgi:nucleoside-diphosphate-sugar epimerase